MTLFIVPFQLYINLNCVLFFCLFVLIFFFLQAEVVSLFLSSVPHSSLPLLPPLPLPLGSFERCVYFSSSLYDAVVLKRRPCLWKCWGITIHESFIFRVFRIIFFFFFIQMLLFSNADLKRRGGGGMVDCGEAGVKSGRDGGKKKKKECSLGRRNKAASECGGGGGRLWRNCTLKKKELRGGEDGSGRSERWRISRMERAHERGADKGEKVSLWTGGLSLWSRGDRRTANKNGFGNSQTSSRERGDFIRHTHTHSDSLVFYTSWHLSLLFIFLPRLCIKNHPTGLLACA